MATPFAALVRERRERLSVVVISGAFGAVAGVGVSDDVPRGFLQGTLSGIFVSTLMQVRDAILRRVGVSRLPFGLFVVVAVLTMTATICAGLALAALPWLVVHGVGSWRPYAIAFALAFLASVAFSVWFALDRLLGGDVLLGLLTGRYHRPRHEERIFLFADLEGSTGVAERLGELRYHSFLNRAFGDLADPVERHGGAIYQYVGDELVVTWPLERGSRDGACLRCARAMLAALADRADDYVREFGVSPRVRLALHCGPVVAGEIGDLRREIVYTGDTVNTAARIEALAKAGDHTLVVSADVLARAPLPEGLSARSLGLQTFRGKDAALELFAVETG